ncbi:MAG: carbohydrate binding family 9 domain-containing protein, partial [Gemmatimonadales bacterium]
MPLRSQNIHPTPPPEVRAVPLQGGAALTIQVDGRLEEPVWQASGGAPAATEFRQNQPNEGAPATQRTEVRFAFDDAALYVGARMYDDSGGRGVRTRLVRRDDEPSSDYLQVIFDTYHDHIGRLFFAVNPSGVRYDANGLGGGEDDSWDPVWEVATTIDSLGWTAEMRIPFSQLRFPATQEEQTWGL